MLRCDYCQIDLPGTQSTCPLCRNKPVGSPDDSAVRFPPVTTSHSKISRTVLAWAALGSVIAAVVCVTVNIIIRSDRWWSLFVIAGIASLWVDMGIVLKKLGNLPKNILQQVLVVSLIAFIWDRVTGYGGWSLDYVFPVLSSAAMIAMVVVSKVRKLDIQDYILYLLIDIILGIASFILILTDAVSIVLPSTLSFGGSIVFLAFLLFFEGQALWAEIQRRFHL